MAQMYVRSKPLMTFSRFIFRPPHHFHSWRTTMAHKDVRLKLLIDTNEQRVVFAEADKDVVDFLFHLLSLPLGTVCRLLKKKCMVGCLDNLYESVQALDRSYFQPDHDKDGLLNPEAYEHSSNPPDLAKFYICSYHRKYTQCCNYISDDRKAVCPHCNNYMSQEVTYVKPPRESTKLVTEEGGGYAKGGATYMVMDDLTVKPMSTIFSITLFNKFNIKDMGVLEEKLIDLDRNKGLELLKASLQSNTVLTDVFLSKY